MAKTQKKEESNDSMESILGKIRVLFLVRRRFLWRRITKPEVAVEAEEEPMELLRKLLNRKCGRFGRRLV